MGKYNDKPGARIFNAFAISFQLLGLIYFAQFSSGAALNPCVGSVQVLYQWWVMKNYPKTYIGTDSVSLDPLWIYVSSTLCGGFFAGLFNHFHEYAMWRMKQNYGIYDYKIECDLNNMLEQQELMKVSKESPSGFI